MKEAVAVDLDDFSILEVKKKNFKDSCCHSYLTLKGRCYTCPEEDEFEKTLVDENNDF